MKQAIEIRHRVRVGSLSRAALTVEVLEDRNLLSASIVEVEPNNTPAGANVIQRLLDTPVAISGKVNQLGDKDWFKVQLKQGDVFGAALKGHGELDAMIRLFNSAGELMIANDDSYFTGADLLPHESPLPHNQSSVRDPEIYCVIAAAGTYYLEVSAFADETVGKYNLDVVVARPGLESQPVGTRQILFLDFDGAKVQFGGNKWAMAPLVNSLPDWGLTAADEDAVIDAIVARVTDKLSTFVRANRLNGDFASSGNPGEFDLTILDSSHHADEFGRNPFMSRIVVGATDDPMLANEDIGLAENIDVGNYKWNDQAVVSVNFVPSFLDAIQITEARIIDAAAEYLAIIIAHEFAHNAGLFHTDYSLTNPFAGTPTFMDKSFEAPLGPDLVFGTADDLTLQLRADFYHANEGYSGFQDTLNTFSFALSTGKGAAAESTHPTSAVTNRTTSSSGRHAPAGLAACPGGAILSPGGGLGGNDNPNLFPGKGGLTRAFEALVINMRGQGITNGATIIIGGIVDPNQIPGMKGLGRAFSVQRMSDSEDRLSHGRLILVNLFDDAIKLEALGDLLL